MIRRSSLALVATLALAVSLLGCSASQPEVPPTGNTTTVQVAMIGGFYVPDVIEVPAGDRLVIELSNDDPELHDLVVENGAATSRFGKGQSETLDVGVISKDLEAWCSIPPHREMGMVLAITVLPAP